jgi:hypothetical protein
MYLLERLLTSNRLVDRRRSIPNRVCKRLPNGCCNRVLIGLLMCLLGHLWTRHLPKELCNRLCTRLSNRCGNSSLVTC